MVDKPKIFKLVENLKEKTQNSEINWEETGDENLYQASFPKYSVQIQKWKDFDSGNDEYSLFIINQDGRVIEEITRITLGYAQADSDLSIIFNYARSIAMGVDQAINDILDYLGDEPNMDDAPF